MISRLPEPSAKLALGTAYTITNAQGMESCLIGITHISDEEMIKQSCFHRIMEKCSILYTEKGISEFVPSSHLSIPEGRHAFEHLKYRFKLDLAITLEAYFRKIPIKALDLNTGLRQQDEQTELYYKTVCLAGIDKYLMNNAEMAESVPAIAEELDHVKYGNIDRLIVNRANELDDSDVRREERWQEILIPVLQMTQTPICIAVGYIHVVGENGLAESFQKAGLYVKRIQSTCEADLAKFSAPREIIPRVLALSPVWLPSLGQPCSDIFDKMAQTQPTPVQTKQVSQVEIHQRLPYLDFDFDLLLGLTVYPKSRV